MKIVKSTSTLTRCLLLGLVSWLAFVASASAQAVECVPPGWPTEVSYSPGPGSSSDTLSFGPATVGVAYAVEFGSVVSQVITGDHIQLVVVPFVFCGIGVPPPAVPMEVPVSALADGQYRVSLELRLGTASTSVQNLPLTVTGSAGDANVIPTLSPSQLLALLGVLLAVGLASVRYRANTRDQRRS